MSKKTEMTVSRAVKVNVGNYEAVDFFVSSKSENPDGITPEDAVDLNTTVEKVIGIALVKHYAARGKKVTLAQVAKNHGLGFISK